MQTIKLSRLLAAAVLIGGFSLTAVAPTWAADKTLLNVSYDPTRELYKDFNAAFAEKWKKDTGETVTIQASHGGSGEQAALGHRRSRSRCRDVGAGRRYRRHRQGNRQDSGRLEDEVPENNSAPYTSTIVFLVRKGNPKGIKDWARPGQGRRPGDHAEPEDLGRRSLELPGSLGMGARSQTAATTPRRRNM